MSIKPLILTTVFALFLPTALVASEITERAEVRFTQALSQRVSMDEPLNIRFANSEGQSDAMTQTIARLSARSTALEKGSSTNKRTTSRAMKPLDW
ncbi:hypothetical protein [Halomonas sp. M20]|uniref:hypothetical protein n=1 Tax=Halomonas sp. M20 TaxID=2763264 RepID=UPI001D0B86E6|nr:hypothetical protein [Halomonas sp. M20]